MNKTRSYLIASLFFLLSFNWANAQCLIEDVTVSVHSCDGDWFMVDIDFNNLAVSDSVTVAGNGNQYGTFSSVDLPITLGPFAADNSTIYEFVVTDYQNFCSDFGEVGPVDCSSSNCNITDLIVEAHPCDNDHFLVDINFNYQNMPSDSFHLVGNGTNYGTFAYADLWLTFGPIAGDGNTEFEFIVIDQNDPNCSEETGLDPINCGGACEIGGIEIWDIDCNNNETYNFNLNFSFANVNNDFFDVFANGEFFGFYAFADLPLTIENFPMSGNPNDVLTICQNDLPSCCATYEFDSPNCDPTDCQITDLIVEAHPCDNDHFLVDINFNYQNMPSDSFHLVGNGTNYGTFAYADLWLTFGPIAGDGNTEFEFIVIDSENNDCTAFTTLDPIDCDGGGDCEIWDMEVWDFECNDDGTYNLNLNFNYANVNNDFFDVFANGEFFGFYAFADLPIHIENFPGSGNIFDAIKVCQNDLPTCCETLEFEAPECGTSDCFGFEDLVLNTVYTTPDYQNDDLIFTTGGVPVKFQEFYQQSTTKIGSIHVADNNLAIYQYPNFIDHFLQIDSSNLEFNFLQLGQAVVQVEFDFFAPGLWINMSANDAPTSEAASFFEMDGIEIAPGVTMTVIPDPTIDHAGKVILEGFMGLLTIGGESDLSIDNLCLSYAAIGDCWAGDTNSDFIANNFDLLNIGLAYGTEGTPRDDVSIAWVAQPSDDWTQTFEDGTNYKHADANGDGIINAQDKFAIDENFGLTHGNVVPYISPTPSSDDPAFFIVMPNPNDIGVGAFEAEIHLGTTANAIDAIYGLAFTVEFNAQVFDASSMEISFESGWFNNNGADDLLSVQKEKDGKLAAAVSRINQSNISGGGKIGTINGIIDDLSGYSVIDLDIINVKGITTNETLVPFNTPENYVEVGTGIIENKLSRNLSIFPNPASDLIFIKNDNEAPIENIRLINILGQEILQKNIDKNGMVELNVSKISQGIYFLEIQLDGFKVTRKIEISN